MSTKKEQLDDFNKMIPDLSEEYLDNWKIGDEHHILYGGNPDARILVISESPDKSELYWARRNNTHTEYVCCGPGGNIFKSHAKLSGFNVEKDFLYVNNVPYFSLGARRYGVDIMSNASWVVSAVREIVKPYIIITLGYPVYYALTMDSNVERYEDNIDKIVDTDDDYILVTMDNPDEVWSDHHTKHKSFYKTLERLYPIFKTINRAGYEHN